MWASNTNSDNILNGKYSKMKNMNNPDRELYARQFALKAHGTQKYGKFPYIYHLDAVVSLVKPYLHDAVILAYLHDTVEDTPITLEDIEKNFGSRMAELVNLITDPEGRTRAERKKIFHERSLSVTPNEKFLEFFIVKAADRLANIRASVSDGRKDLLKMYLKEHEEFTRAIYRPRVCDHFWNEMNYILGAVKLFK